MRGRPVPVGEDVDELVRSDKPGRERWLDRRQPVAPDANWWLHLLLLLDKRRMDRPAELVACVELTVSLLVQARERSAALSRDEVAQRLAHLVARTRSTQLPPAVLPSADAVVRECLDAIPVSVQQVAVLTDRQDLHALTRSQMMDSRRAKNLVHAAEQHLDDIEDPELANRLRAWLAIKPHLV